MSDVKVGERVFALQRIDGRTIYLYGFGTRVEDSVPVGAAGWGAALLCAARQKAPCIRLDSGEVLWVCECWWGHEKDFGGGGEHEWEVVLASVDQDRDRFLITCAVGRDH